MPAVDQFGAFWGSFNYIFFHILHESVVLGPQFDDNLQKGQDLKLNHIVELLLQGWCQCQVFILAHLGQANTSFKILKLSSHYIFAHQAVLMY